jgi:hypothetical protein
MAEVGGAWPEHCSTENAPKSQLFPEFVNSTNFFTVGTVPHPYTINSLYYTRDNLDVSIGHSYSPTSRCGHGCDERAWL